MIVYCDVEECRHNKDGKCGCVWPVGIEAIGIEQTPFGVECMDVDVRGEEEKKGDERMPDLKNCPFCSGKVKTIVRAEKLADGENYIDFTISCLGCGITKNARMKYGIHGASFLDVEKAIDEVVLAWNRRANNG